MNIKEVKEKIELFNLELTTAVEQFQSDTGCVVYDLTVSKLDISTHDKPNRILTKVKASTHDKPNRILTKVKASIMVDV